MRWEPGAGAALQCPVLFGPLPSARLSDPTAPSAGRAVWRPRRLSRPAPLPRMRQAVACPDAPRCTLLFQALRPRCEARAGVARCLPIPSRRTSAPEPVSARRDPGELAGGARAGRRPTRVPCRVRAGARAERRGPDRGRLCVGPALDRRSSAPRAPRRVQEPPRGVLPAWVRAGAPAARRDPARVRRPV